MMQHLALLHRFVRSVPRELEPGVLYVSMDYATAVHSCCCGCDQRIVTPFTPTDWKMTFDGESISLFPSVGNWQIPCQSHYIVRGGRVIEAGPWTRDQVARELHRDQKAKRHHYDNLSSNSSLVQPVASPVEPRPVEILAIQPARGVWGMILRWFRGPGK